MVFKPWTEREPRHQFEDLTLQSNPLPKVIVSAELSNETLVIPYTLASIQQALLKTNGHKQIGEVRLFKTVKRQIESEEYLEDEQLYKPVETSSTELSSTIPIHEIVLNEGKINVIVVPTFEDVVNYNVISKELVQASSNGIITITPGNLSFGQIIAEIGSNGTEFDALVPPFVITGISGSLVSEGKLQGKEVLGLVLQSEGVTGYEKINLESIEVISSWLLKKYKLSTKFTTNLEKLINNHSSVNSFGLYI